MYESSRVDALYCCAQGFSNEVCAESLTEEAELKSIFGSTEEEVLSQLVEVELQGWPVWVHWRMAPAVERVNERLKEVSYQIDEPVDCFFWSEIPGTGVMSRHSFGIALDINPSSNPCCGVTQSCRCYNDLITDMPADFVQAFTSEGFEWGGDWSDHPDPMHFEWTGWRQ